MKKEPNKLSRDKWVIQELLKIPKGFRLLDVGAGTSPYRIFCKHLIYESQDFCQLDPQQMGGKNYPLHTFASDVCSIPAPDATYDAILCTEALEHFPRPIEAIGEMVRLLKMGGTLFLTAPLGSGLHQKPYHYYGGFTPFWYEYVCKEYGLGVKSIQPSGGFFFLLAQECARAEVFLRKSIDCKKWTKLLWLILGPILRCFIAPVFRIIDRPSASSEFTIGYHVVCVKQKDVRN